MSQVTATNTALLTNLNFHGGTLKAAGGHTSDFIQNVHGIYSYDAGAMIDNNGTNITINSQLLATTDSGVTSIPVTNGGSGYAGAPQIQVNGGNGSGATAVAIMADDGTGNGTFKVASITITNPGTGYTIAPTAAQINIQGNATTNLTFGNATLGTNSPGNFTFTGSGTTTLSGNNTYTGNTIISGGTTLELGSANAVQNSKLVSSVAAR